MLISTYNWELYAKLQTLVNQYNLEEFKSYFSEDYDPSSLNLSSLQNSILAVVNHQEAGQ